MRQDGLAFPGGVSLCGNVMALAENGRVRALTQC
jgi:hypothetical protein